MIAALKSEFRKILTVRSTYIILAISTALIILFAFYLEGLRVTSPILDMSALAKASINAITTVAGIGALVGVLLMTHEYRYNTIMYTLTASRSRTQTLLAKFIAISCFAVLFTLAAGILSPVLMTLALHIKGVEMVPQVMPVWDLLWRGLFVGWGYSIIALLFAVLLRHQVGTIVAIFFLPGTIEPILGFLLKKNAMYLPYSSLQSVLAQESTMSHGKAALIFMIYIVVGWAVAWYLFLRRDAN